MYKYKEDPNISDMRGIPKDTSSDYFPQELTATKKKKNKNSNDALFSALQQFKHSWYSNYLYASKETVLYNYYLGFDIFRFLWIRAFNLPIIIKLSNRNGKIILETKKLSKHPQKNDLLIDLEIHTIKELSENDWDQFLELLNAASFWETNPFDKEDWGVDGSDWIIEGHTKDKYWFVYRWSPDKKNLFHKCGKFLIELSGIDEVIY